MNDPRTPPALPRKCLLEIPQFRSEALACQLQIGHKGSCSAAAPPALSNATPPCDNCGKPSREHYCWNNTGDYTFHSSERQELAAAPPVAEGPAATPRPEWRTIRHKSEAEAERAAAEPPEARAAARKWETLWHDDYDGQRVDLAEAESVAADLQRQLDEARRELADSREWHKQACEDREEVDRMYAEAKARIEGLTGQLEGLAINRDETLKKLKRAESAEAANQKLRRDWNEIKQVCRFRYDEQRELAKAEHLDWSEDAEDSYGHILAVIKRLEAKPAALLGPQYGDGQ